jgi:hypothetical protein
VALEIPGENELRLRGFVRKQDASSIGITKDLAMPIIPWMWKYLLVAPAIAALIGLKPAAVISRPPAQDHPPP